MSAPVMGSTAAGAAAAAGRVLRVPQDAVATVRRKVKVIRTALATPATVSTVPVASLRSGIAKRRRVRVVL
jgi:hypothetical protein